MNMKASIILLLLFSHIAIAMQDGVCIAPEEERLRALRSLVAPVNELLKKSEQDVTFVSELDEKLVRTADKAINQDYVAITGSSSWHKMANALAHYCITKYLPCGQVGSHCYVSLSTGEGKCYARGLGCTQD